MSAVQLILSLLESHSGRGKVLRLIQYGSNMFAGTSMMPENMAKRLLELGKQLSMCRTILRRFDDLPMLSHTLSYGLGKKEEGYFLRAISVLQNLIDQCFFPTEHIAWAADVGILKISSDRWWTYGVYCWFGSLSLEILRNIIILTRLRHSRMFKLKRKNSKNDLTILRSDTNSEQRSSASSLSPEEIANVKTVVARCADLMLAIHFMPSGFLWSGKLPKFYVGLFGVISTAIPLHSIVMTKLAQNRSRTA